MGWHVVANATPQQKDASFLLPLGIFLVSFYYYFLLSHDVLVELNLGLSDILEILILFCKNTSHLYPFDCDSKHGPGYGA